jgi:UDP-glucose 4-epimerase
MKILVTGGLGYIGSHTAVVLLEKGYEVLLVDNLSNTRAEVLDGIAAISGKRPEWLNIDLADPAACRLALEGHQLDGIIHFAAYKAVGESVQEPLKYYQNNLGSLVNLLDYVSKHPSCGFIFSSSCTVYGQADQLPITEDAPVKAAESPYGNTKQIGEEIIQETAAAKGLKTIALRYFNPIGAHSSALIGELPLGIPQTLVPYITQSAAGLRGPLRVYGNDYPTPDGTPLRDYIHVMDLANAHRLALERILSGNSADGMEIFNLGSGTGSSVLQVIQAFERVTNEKLEWSFAPRREGDQIATYADTTKAREVLGWVAEKSLDEAMRDAWAWQVALGSDSQKP